MAPEDLERINAYFRDHFRGHSFRMSMGELDLQTGAMHVVMGLISHGMTVFAADESKYRKAVFGSFREMNEYYNQLKSHGLEQSSTACFAMILALVMGNCCMALDKLGIQE